jgi:hypothetical protein
MWDGFLTTLGAGLALDRVKHWRLGWEKKSEPQSPRQKIVANGNGRYGIHLRGGTLRDALPNDADIETSFNGVDGIKAEGNPTRQRPAERLGPWLRFKGKFHKWWGGR